MVVVSCPHMAGDTCPADDLITQPALWLAGQTSTRTLKRHRQEHEVQVEPDASCPDVFDSQVALVSLCRCALWLLRPVREKLPDALSESAQLVLLHLWQLDAAPVRHKTHLVFW